VDRRPPSSDVARRSACCARALRAAIVVAVCACAAVPVHAEDELVRLPLNDEWRWTEYTAGDGLPSGSVLAMVESTRGVPWVATTAGVAWFDGYRWHAVDGLGREFTETATLSATPDGGVLAVVRRSLWRGDERGLRRVPVRIDGAERRVRSAVCLANGDALVDSEHAFLRIDERGATAFPRPGSPRRLASFLSTGPGAVWAAASDGLYELVDEEWVRRFHVAVPIVRAASWGGLIAVNRGGALAGLWQWGRDGGEPVRLPGEGSARVRTMDIDVNGNAVVAYSSGRVRVGDGTTWEWLRRVPPQLVNPSGVRFRANGDLWVACDGALWLCRVSAQRWQHHRLSRTGEAIDQINDVVVARTGDVWLATSAGVVVHRAGGATEVIEEAAGQALGIVTAVVEDDEGGIWVGSGDNIVGTLRLLDGRWTAYGPAEGFPLPRVHRIERDVSGRLWFLGMSPTRGSDEPGAVVWDGTSFDLWDTGRGLPDGRVYAFAEGPDGSCWFGTFEGLARWRDGAWTVWTRDEGLWRDRVFALTVDAEGTAWYGHQIGGGLGRIGADDIPRYLDTADGLVDDQVCDLAVAPGGAVWISTANGVGRLKDGRFASFTRRQGLSHPHVWPIVPRDDRVFIGSIGGGLYVLDLAEADAPPPAIEVATPLLDGDTAVFRWKAFAYQGIQSPADVRTRHRLDDGNWSPWSTAREVSVMERTRCPCRPWGSSPTASPRPAPRSASRRRSIVTPPSSRSGRSGSRAWSGSASRGGAGAAGTTRSSGRARRCCDASSSSCRT
jgi:sugar lactone lactonase YvrE